MQTRTMNERKTYSLLVLTKSIDKWDHLWASSIDNPLHSWRRHQWQPFIKMHSKTKIKTTKDDSFTKKYLRCLWACHLKLEMQKNIKEKWMLNHKPLTLNLICCCASSGIWGRSKSGFYQIPTPSFTNVISQSCIN